ncbi:MAG: hypothetical protein COB83_02080 [Gammaproteobacteria bacterium]|nr:MAG: hypothetical protein COB83_02080 [Gammaproteobacteria bacterium]
MKLNSAFFSSLFVFRIVYRIVFSVIFSVIPLAVSADEQAERWFEIEVILFKQLNNKAALKEQFPDNINTSNLPKYTKSFDLLNPYLQANLTRIKQFVPLCGEKDAQHQFLDSLQSVSTPFPEQIKSIEQLAEFEMPDFSEYSIASKNALAHEKSTANAESEAFEEDIFFEENIKENEQTAAVNLAFDFQEEALAKPIFSTQNICVISANEIEELFDKEQLTDFKLDSFGVAGLPKKLNAAGAHVSDNPYLIADDSLLLKDISQRLRWSKEFKPLLHFGWRQVGITKSKAIPLKLFAGEHLGYQYQQALTAFRANIQAEIKTEEAIEENLLEQLAQVQNMAKSTEQNTAHVSENIDIQDEHESSLEPVDNKLKLKIEHKQQALNELFSRLDNLNNINTNNNQLNNETLAVTIEHIEQQTLENILATNEVETTQQQQILDNSIAPTKPLQPWFLEGFFKVHLDRYLYITADFNVLSNHQVARQSNPKQSESDNKTSESKLINFSQNKRVISGEIHYFDHPYIGMIVQIRRFDPSKPRDEAVTQAIK